MRVNHILGALLVATTIGIGGTTLSAPTTAQAKAKSSLTTFPKNMRGTWYHYEENKGYYYKSMKFSAKKLTVKNYFDAYGRKKSKRVMTLHAAKSSLNYRQGLSNKKFKQHLVSAFAANGSYTQVTPYGFLATDGLGKYKVIHKTYKGKSVKVLYNNLNDDHFKVKDHFYQTKAQAKYFNPVGALHK